MNCPSKWSHSPSIEFLQDTILDPRSLIAALMISFTVVDGVLARRSLNCADFICFLSHASQNINAHESAWSTYIIDECKAIATWPKIAGVVNKLEIGNLLVQILGKLLTVNFVATHGITKFVIDKLMLLQGNRREKRQSGLWSCCKITSRNKESKSRENKL